MKALMMIFLGLVLTVVLNGCAAKVSSESKSYELEQNGCKTGRHEFSSQADYCKGLRDDALNNYCAAGLREDSYQHECSNPGIAPSEPAQNP